MVPVTKKDLRNLVSQTTIETYEELTPQLIQLIDMKSCTNEIIIEVLAEILGLEDEE